MAALSAISASTPCTRPMQLAGTLRTCFRSHAYSPIKHQRQIPWLGTARCSPPDSAVVEQAAEQDLNCVAIGMDVQCELPSYSDDEDTGAVLVPAPLTAAATEEEPLLQRALTLALLVSPFFFWGTSMVAMKGVTEHVTPLFLGSLRLLPAGIILVLWATWTGRATPSGAAAWGWIALFGLVDGAMFQGFLAQGLYLTTAGLGSIIIDSQPLTVALLASLLLGERLTPVAITGLMVGVAGLLLLEVPAEALANGPSSLLHLDLSGVSPSSLLGSGEFWMLLAAQSMAVGTIMVRWVTKHCDPVMATGWHMVLGGLMLQTLSLLTESEQLAPRLEHFSGFDALAMTYVVLLGGAASYGIFFYEASKGNLTALSSLTFLTPVFAASTGYLALHEGLTPLQLGGATITLLAVFMINNRAKPA